MKYVITGGAGHISRPLTEKLLAGGHQVTVIGRNPQNLEPLVQKGAQSAIGSVEDPAFLKQAFKGADAVYTMVPPFFGAPDWKKYIQTVGENYVQAIRENGIRYVVNLSSVGAHLNEGCGPVSGLFRVEKALNSLPDVNVIHLRPGFFFINFLANVDMVKHMNIIGGNFGDAQTRMVLADIKDIADAASEELLQLKFRGHSVRYIASDERTTGEVATVIGNAISKPELPWVQFNDEQTLAGMLQAGFPEEIAKNYAEMGAAIRTGIMQEDYWKHKPALGKTRLEDFAASFASVYNAN
jgi:uncharacterized protein YbjT (DUF2867 family)